MVYCETLETNVQVIDGKCQMVSGFGKTRYPCSYMNSRDCPLQNTKEKQNVMLVITRKRRNEDA
jgi:hypothetical protein